MNITTSACPTRDHLRATWYKSPPEMREAALRQYRRHLQMHDTCRADLDAQFARLKAAQYPDVDWETLEIRSHHDLVS